MEITNFNYFNLISGLESRLLFVSQNKVSNQQQVFYRLVLLLFLQRNILNPGISLIVVYTLHVCG